MTSVKEMVPATLSKDIGWRPALVPVLIAEMFNAFLAEVFVRRARTPGVRTGSGDTEDAGIANGQH